MEERNFNLNNLVSLGFLILFFIALIFVARGVFILWPVPVFRLPRQDAIHGMTTLVAVEPATRLLRQVLRRCAAME